MAYRRLNANNLKVDAIALDINQIHRPSGQKKKLVVFNFNIPVEFVQNAVEFQSALERIRDFLVQQFNGREEKVFYQVTASYYLIHSETGERKVWVGSFKSDLNTGIVSDFKSFNRNNFARLVIDSCRNVEERLTWTDRDTKWTFDGLRSIIINSQIDLLENDFVIKQNNLRGHVQQTFAL